jgi:SAM-dependent methyltransferase
VSELCELCDEGSVSDRPLVRAVAGWQKACDRMVPTKCLGSDRVMSIELARHFDWVSKHDRAARRAQAGFHAELAAQLAQLIPVGSRVLDAGCAGGELLRALRPSRGLGLEISEGMLQRARGASLGSACEFRLADACTFHAEESFDYIVADFLVGYLTDVQACLENLQHSAHERTRLCITSVNNAWSPLLRVGQWLGVVTPQPPSNWLSTPDLINILELAGWEVLHRSTEQLLPIRLPLLSGFLNRFVVRLPLFRHFGSTIYLVARPARRAPARELSCSVIIPARNESGNIRPALERIAVMGSATEVIFVEGNSADDTWEVIQREVAAYRGLLKVSALKQPGRGKWDAVRTGFAAATGDVLVIQDADLTAPPEDLPKFFSAISSGAAEFANGSRLVYPMEKQAMRFLNLLGNKFFAYALSYVLGQPIKDSLCGTKMLLRSDYQRICRRIEVLGDFDPFGDFNLLFGAALLKLRIRDIPVRYKDRTYGETNISRFRHGWLLLKMTAFGLLKLKFGR